MEYIVCNNRGPNLHVRITSNQQAAFPHKVIASTVVKAGLILIVLVLGACSSVPPKPALQPDTATRTAPTEQAGKTKKASKTSPTLASMTRKQRLERGVCKDMDVSNAPVLKSPPARSKFACADGISLYVNPALGSCITSGFGHRSGGKHRGIDYQRKPAGPIVAAAAGTIIEKTFRQKDYGNWIVIDHGRGIYSSYAHLASVEGGLKKGMAVKQGQKLGIMGRTGNAAQAVHLHYEVRKGDYNNSKKWWGLTALNPYSLPKEKCNH